MSPVAIPTPTNRQKVSDNFVRLKQIAARLKALLEAQDKGHTETELVGVQQELEVLAMVTPRSYYQFYNIIKDAIKKLSAALGERNQGIKRLVEINRTLIVQLRSAQRMLNTLATAEAAIYGTFDSWNEDGTANVLIGNQKRRSFVNPLVKDLVRGQEVILHPLTLNLLLPSGFRTSGAIHTVKGVLADGRLVLSDRVDEELVYEVGGTVADLTFKPGDRARVDPRSGFVLEKLPSTDAADLLLEEIPPITFEDIGGLEKVVQRIREAVEWPYMYPEYFARVGLNPPKGVLLHGPPGCGKTMLVKAVARSIAEQVRQKTGFDVKSFFINVKGPELLNMFVGETERRIREIFRRAKETAVKSGNLVVIFFDELESFAGVRGSGISSDVERTIVPQLLAEIDGVEALRGVLVFGASNREDLIDPALLRPGRFDEKIGVERPGPQALCEIFEKHFDPKIPIHPKYFEEPIRSTPNRLKTLCPDEWETVNKILANVRSCWKLEVKPLEKTALPLSQEARDTAERTIEVAAVFDPERAKAMKVTLEEPREWELEEWILDRDTEKIRKMFILKTVEAMCIKTPDPGGVVWWSRSGIFIQINTQIVTVIYRNGDREILYFGDIGASGAAAASILARAKLNLVRRMVAQGPDTGIMLDDIFRGIREEVTATAELPSGSASPDDWARIIGRGGQQIQMVIPVGTNQPIETHRRVERQRKTGQYL